MSAVAAVALFAITAAFRLMAFTGFSNDHYVHLARAQQVLLGAWPVRDFVDPGMPLMYLVSAGAWWLGSGRLGAEVWLVDIAFALGALCTFIVARRLSGSTTIAAAATVLEVIIWPRSYSYPKVLLYAATAWAMLAWLDGPSRRRLIQLGGLVGVAFLFRHDHGLYLGAAAACAVALGSAGSGRAALVPRLVTLTATALLVAAPWLVYVARYQGLVDYFEAGLSFSRAEAQSTLLRELPRFRVSPEDGMVSIEPPYRPVVSITWSDGTTSATRRELEERYQLEPVPHYQDSGRGYYVRTPSITSMRALADDQHVAGSSGIGRVLDWSAADAAMARLSPSRLHLGAGLHLADNAYVWLFYLFYALPFASAAVVWRQSATGRLRWAGEGAMVGALALMGLVANAGLIRGNLAVWLPDAIVPAVLLGAWLVVVAWRTQIRRADLRIAARAATAVVVLVTAAAIASVGDFRERLDKTDLWLGIDGVRQRAAALTAYLGRTHHDLATGPSGVAQGLSPFFRYVQRCTEPRDRLFFSFFYPDVFVAAGRGFAGGQVFLMTPFYTSMRDQQLVLERMRGESVPFMLLFLDREASFRNSYPLLSNYMDQEYEPMADVPVAEAKGVRIFVERARHARRTDAETGWPCFA